MQAPASIVCGNASFKVRGVRFVSKLQYMDKSFVYVVDDVIISHLTNKSTIILFLCCFSYQL